MENYLDLINDDEKNEILKIKECNKLTNKYGLMLNEKQIYNLLEKKRDVLKSTGRIEFINEYVYSIDLENEFCRLFESEKIDKLLYIYSNRYIELVINIIVFFQKQEILNI